MKEEDFLNKVNVYHVPSGFGYSTDGKSCFRLLDRVVDGKEFYIMTDTYIGPCANPSNSSTGEFLRAYSDGRVFTMELWKELQEKCKRCESYPEPIVMRDPNVTEDVINDVLRGMGVIDG